MEEKNNKKVSMSLNIILITMPLMIDKKGSYTKYF